MPGVALVTLTGEHDLYGAQKLQERLETSISEGLAVVVDLTETVFIDSTVVGVLLKAQKLAASADLDYRVVMSDSTGDSVRRMFEITGLTQILPIIERDSALPHS